MNAQTGNKYILLILFVGLLSGLTFIWWEQDDFYIHAQYARNLATAGEWSFNPGESSYGSTSPLWVITLAIPVSLGAPVYATGKILSLSFFILSLFQLNRWRSHFHHPALHTTMLIVVAANHWLRLSTGSGMEATLAACLAIEFAHRLSIARPGRSVDLLIAGIFGGLAVLTRPEFAYLVVVVVLIPPWQLAHFTRRMVFTALGALVVIGPWLLYAQLEFGALIPQTIHIKTTSHSAHAGNPLLLTLSRTLAFYTPALALEMVAVLLFSLDLLRRRAIKPLFDISPAIWLTALGMPAVYVLNQLRASEGITYRYAAPVIGMLIYLGFRCLDQWLNMRPARRIWLKPTIIVMVLFALLAQTAMSLLHLPALKRSRHYVHGVLWPAAEWLRDNTPPDAGIACFDVGVIGFVSERRVLDFIGLISPDIFAHIQARDGAVSHAELIEHFRPDYLFFNRPRQDGDPPDPDIMFQADYQSYRFTPREAFQHLAPEDMIGGVLKLRTGRN